MIALMLFAFGIAGAAALPASALYVSIFNAAIGTGAMIGAWLLEQGGLASIFGFGGAGATIAIALIVLSKTSPKTAA